MRHSDSILPAPARSLWGDVEPELIAGVYALVGGSGDGKTLTSVVLADMVPVYATYVNVNESHGVLLPLAWLLQELKPQGGFFGSVWRAFQAGAFGSMSDLIPGAKDKNDVFTPAISWPDTPVVVLDSITKWLWESERLALTPAEVQQQKLSVTFGSSAAKSGGLTGEAQEFLLMLDEAARVRDQCVIAVVNYDQYPMGVTQGHDAKRRVYRLLKGMVSGVMFASLAPGGASYVSVSDRAGRAERQIPLDSSLISAACAALQIRDESLPGGGAIGASPSSNLVPNVARRR